MSDRIKLRLLGFFVGLIGPPIALYVYYLIYYHNLEFKEFINRLIFATLLAPMLSLAALINLLLFFVFIWTNKDEGAKGVLFSTILYAFVVLIMKIF